MEIRVHGARGSAPVSGAEFLRFGGHTTCFEIELPDGDRVLIDCGSGLRHVESRPISSEEPPAFSATILLTHFHWDHIQGLPFLPALYRASSRLHVVATPPEGLSVEEALGRVFRPPWFPIHLADVPAKLSFEAITGPLSFGAIEVEAAPLPHPGGVNGYRINIEGRVIAIATDVELSDDAGVEAVSRFAEGASVLVHDAQYTPEEYVAARRGWGHSTWEQATEIAAMSGVERLVLTSHDPTRSDDAVDAIVTASQKRFPNTSAAFEGQRLEL